ncbi:type III-B CRISPR module RAMP protein Cmr6 [Microbacterium sp.]|uniref:type III-B CRISPR module RAMP protein Cmr6 n=1 Tax=Microbacterium sp. TaxID=51671 RepID=UPI0039E41CD8
MVRAYGPYGRRVTVESLRSNRMDEANGTLVLRRLAFPAGSDEERREVQGEALAWAERTGLGVSDGDSVSEAARSRRRAALDEMANQPGWVARELPIKLEWRMAIGLGDKGGPYEIGISLHGTYGWPIIPASSLKGLVRHWALQAEIADEFINKYLGAPAKKRDRGSESVEAEGNRGSVLFFEALPEPSVQVVRDVVTPHHSPYYARHAAAEAGEDHAKPAPPAGWNNPVPASFLTVSGTLTAALAGPESDVLEVRQWAVHAMDELGIGGKTAAGYGYVSRPDGEG